MPTPTVRFDEIIILGPDDGQHFETEREVLLEWAPVGPLGKDEWYAVRMNWQEGAAPAFGGTNTQDTFWIVPPEQYYGRANAETNRAYNWHVFVEKATEDNNGDIVNIPISVISEERTFFWE